MPKSAKKETCIILIDGSNFYFKLKSLGIKNLLHFNYSAFAKYISTKRRLVSSHYYIGAVRTGKSAKAQKLFNNQRRLLVNLKKHKFQYSLGYLLKSGGSYHEKAVDVNIAVDILVAAYENLCDRIVLVSSDTDLLPAIAKARQQGKAVEHIGFSHEPSLAMIANCTESRLFTKTELEKFAL
ncbi:MAG: NYN domain-containing protein [bacterium]